MGLKDMEASEQPGADERKGGKKAEAAGLIPASANGGGLC